MRHQGEVSQPINTVIRDRGEKVLTNKFASALAGVADVLPIGVALPDLIDADGHIYLDPPFQDAGAAITLEAAMARSSRALGAGATLITSSESMIPIGQGPEKIMARQKTQFSTFEPVAFSVVDFDTDPDAEVPVSSLPVADSEIDRDAMVHGAVAFRLSRRQLKHKDRKRLATELLWPIAQGVGRAIDATLFSALAGLPNNYWILEKAVAQSLPFSALGAIVGTNAVRAQPVEGKLFVDGIPAQLSADLTETRVGVWSRAAIVVDPDINLTVTRTDAKGGLELVCWVSMQALVPNPDLFWVVDDV